MPDLREIQASFTAQIRDPEHAFSIDGVAPERMSVYATLFYNNIENLISSTYPVLSRLLARPKWQALVKTFFAKHPCQTPLFPYLPQEFLSFLTDEYVSQPDDPPFLKELAHYEWVELAVSIDTQTVNWDIVDTRTPDFLNGVPIVSPWLQLLAYQYPVHEINVDFQPQTPPETPTYLVVYRDANEQVCFLNLNMLSAHLLYHLIEQPDTGLNVLTEIIHMLQHSEPEVVISGGLEIMQAWFKRGILLGIHREYGYEHTIC